MNLHRRMMTFFGKQTKSWLIAEGLVLVGIIGILDYLTGYEVAFYPFYSVPILLVLWFGGNAPAIFISILSGLAWWFADAASGHIYSQPWLRPWDFIVRLMFFYLVVVAGAALRRQRDESQSRIRLLERSQKLEQEIISISEREQQRIGRDLHDGLGQHLVAIGLAADSLKEELENESPGGAKAVGQLADLLHDAVARTRDLAHGLSPVDRDENGLESALAHLALSVSRLSKIRCSFDGNATVNVQDNTIAVHLFRIAQEAVNNAVKHAKAASIVISLNAAGHQIMLTVSDDGIGFDGASPGNGMGLNIMHYRARMSGGSLSISRNQPSGTVVTCTVATPA
jgi:signal transduction histidine kinase